MDWSAKDTIVGLATPPGRGGVALVRVSGKAVEKVFHRVFRITQNPTDVNAGVIEGASASSIASHYLYFGQFLELVREDEVGSDPSPDIIDHGFATLMRAPRSFTGEDVVEFHLHGGVAGAQRLMNSIVALSDHQTTIRFSEPGEFSFRAFLNQKLDLSTAENIDTLIKTQHAVAHRSMSRQLFGPWSQKWNQDRRTLTRQLTELLSQLEADLDFVEEGLETSTVKSRVAELKDIQKTLRHYLRHGRQQEKVNEMVTVCICGAPNAGKSTLFNALLQDQRSIVHSLPGTTRDTLEAQMELAGVPVRLVDTAGIRQLGDETINNNNDLDFVAHREIEKQGIEQSKQWMRRAEILMWVTADPKEGEGVAERISEFGSEPGLGFNKEYQELIVVGSKADLWSPNEREKWGALQGPYQAVSAKMGTHAENGLDQLLGALERLVQHRAQQRQSEELWLNQRQRELLSEAIVHVDRALQLYQLDQGQDRDDVDHELVAESVWQSVRCLEQWSGNELGPKVVEEIFNSFCIGK